MLPDTRYRIDIKPFKKGDICIAQEPSEGSSGYKLWRSWKPEWEVLECASDPFFEIKDDYKDYKDISREEVEKIISDFEKNKE